MKAEIKIMGLGLLVLAGCSSDPTLSPAEKCAKACVVAGLAMSSYQGSGLSDGEKCTCAPPPSAAPESHAPTSAR
jgi:hypothetical protein